MAEIGESTAASREQERMMAEMDAHTLAEAEAIKADTKRHGNATEAAKRLAEAQEARAKAMRDIADARMNYNNSPAPQEGTPVE